MATCVMYIRHPSIVHIIIHYNTLIQQTLEEQIQSPDCLLVDFAKMEVPTHLHIAFMALHQFTLTHNGHLPQPR